MSVHSQLLGVPVQRACGMVGIGELNVSHLCCNLLKALFLNQGQGVCVSDFSVQGTFGSI